MDKCYFCKGKLEDKTVTVDYRWGDKLTVIKNVPAEVCLQCGEKYFDAKVSREMESLILKEEKPSAFLQVPVCEFAGVF